MSSDPRHGVETALEELADIRRAIAWVERNSRSSPIQGSSILRIRILIAVTIFAGALAICELTQTHTATGLLYSAHFGSYEYRFAIILLTAFALLLGVTVLYFAIWRAALREGEKLNSYIERNCVYLRRLNFLSDLFVKFVAVAVVILAGRGDWVAPLLTIFTGDYLLQGRVFILPLPLALVFGVACFIFGTLQLLYLDGLLIYPLIVFLVAGVTSLVFLWREKALS